MARPRLGELDEVVIEFVMRHPVSHGMVREVAGLLAELDNCQDPVRDAAAFYEFQGLLFKQVLTVQGRRDMIRGAMKVVRRGHAAPVPLVATLPDFADLNVGYSFDDLADAIDSGPKMHGDRVLFARLVVEERVSDRVERQLRSVGDALAWKALRFKRDVIVALAGNERTGPMTVPVRKGAAADPPRANGVWMPPPAKAGLNLELGELMDIFEERGRFALLHDLTNCVRIADLSEISEDGPLLREVKASAGHKDPKQEARMRQAVDAVMSGGNLPGSTSGSTLVSSMIRLRTAHDALWKVCQQAERDGVASMKIGQGRVLSALAITKRRGPTDPVQRSGRDEVERWRQMRAAALLRAGVTGADSIFTVVSADTAGREAQTVPLGCLPLPAMLRARLICDVLVFESVISSRAIIDALAGQGLNAVAIPTPALLSAEEEIFRVEHVLPGGKQLRVLTVLAPAVSQLVTELIDPGTWAKAVREVLDSDAAPDSPVITFSGEASVWR